MGNTNNEPFVSQNLLESRWIKEWVVKGKQRTKNYDRSTRKTARRIQKNHEDRRE